MGVKKDSAIILHELGEQEMIDVLIILTFLLLLKILKDFVVRSKNMNGFYAPMIMGWDTHGLPIENALSFISINSFFLSLF